MRVRRKLLYTFWDNHMKKYFFFFILLIFMNASFSQTLNSDSTSTSEYYKLQIELLKEKNNDLLNYQNNLTETLHWALGFGATFLILFLGINIYFLKTRYNEDKENILKHIEDNINLRSKELEDHIGKKYLEFENKWSDVVKNVEDISSKIFDSKINTVKGSLSSLHKQIQNLRINIYDVDRKVLEIDAPKDTLLRTIFDQTKLLKEINDYSYWGWKISVNLGLIEKLISEGAKFDSFDLPDVTKLLDSLPSEYKDAIHRVREKIHSSV